MRGKAKLTDAELRAAHVIYERAGLSLRQLADQLWERLGYASRDSCANAIMAGFMRLGLARRDRHAASVAAATRHGLRAGDNMVGYRRFQKERKGELQPRCAGTRTRDGMPCEQSAMRGSDFCPAHNPERRAELLEHLRRIDPRNAAEAATVNGKGGGQPNGSETRREGNHGRADALDSPRERAGAPA